MAQTWTYTQTYPGTGSNTGWFQAETDNSITLVTGNTFRPKSPRVKVAASASRNDWTWGSTRILQAGIHPSWRTSGTWLSQAVTGAYASGVYSDWQTVTDTRTYNTQDYFNSNNPTERTITFGTWQGGYCYCNYNGSGTENNLWVNCMPTIPTTVPFDFATAYIQLDVPPTADVSPISYDTGYIYSDLTTASVTVSNSAAYYDGTISSVEFKIGNQTATAAGDGTLSIALNAGGTFTPTVTVTDSRGQTYTETFSTITVNTYTPPTVSFDVERTDSTGTPDDEGTYGLIEATLTFADVIATAVAPSVVLTDENGTQTTPTVTWYTDDTLTTTVTWASISSGDTVYGLFSGVNTQYSYSVSVRPRDSEGTGTAITQTLGSAFYTVDFLAGGHGIAFGKPASNVGFECAMNTTFENAVEFNSTVDVGGILTCNDDVYISLTDYQTPSTTDYDIYTAIVNLGWDSDVLIP